jgi:hypothetical protein
MATMGPVGSHQPGFLVFATDSVINGQHSAEENI